MTPGFSGGLNVREYLEHHAGRSWSMALVVRPDQVVSAGWPVSSSSREGESDFFGTTRAILSGQPGS
jgi:hypothetical protein